MIVMRVVVTHDVDHLSVYEHLGDLVIPKFISLSLIELWKGLIAIDEFKKRLNELLRNGWNNIGALVKFDKKHGISSTFFVAVEKGLGISYSLESAEQVIKFLTKEDFDVGLHGINYNNFALMKQEMNKFREISGLEEFGIRMHYLRRSESTLELLNELGYLFDSTVYDENLRQPYPVGRMLEIPLHIMDTYLFSPFYRAFTLESAIEYTETLIKKAREENKTLVILLHQRHFSPSFSRYMEWYKWIIETAQDLGAEFLSCREVAERWVKKL